MAHLGSIDAVENVWRWTKVFGANAAKYDGLKSISALAVDPSGANLAVYGSSPLSKTADYTPLNAYIFILDTISGA